MAKMFDRITVNPQVCMGQATIRGMRITVSFVLKLIGAGMTHDEILRSYPELEKKDLQQVIEYAGWLASEHHLLSGELHIKALNKNYKLIYCELCNAL